MQYISKINIKARYVKKIIIIINKKNNNDNDGYRMQHASNGIDFGIQHTSNATNKAWVPPASYVSLQGESGRGNLAAIFVLWR